MIAAEKLRAICQQIPEYQYGTKTPRARDFYDIWLLLKNFSEDIAWGGEEFRKTIVEMFKVKNVPLEYLARITVANIDMYNYHATDFNSVKDTLPSSSTSLREFDFYFKYVANRVSELKSLWNE